MLPRIVTGTSQPGPERTTLRAGQLTMEYEAGQLRYIRLGSHEIIRGIYAAVRDQNWGTIPFELRDLNIDVHADSFTITFTSHHQQHDIHYVWLGSITGTADNTIRFTFAGEALSTFNRNRIGFCVLHPMAVSGQSVNVEHIDGTTERGAFPVFVQPHQPYYEVRALTHEVLPGVRAEVRMEGDIFEMEDQRNWGDASFKTYCTPHDWPLPVLVTAGERVSQQITLRLIGDPASLVVEPQASVLHLDETAVIDLPPLGLASEAYPEPLTPREIDRLRALRLSHIRYDLHFATGGLPQFDRVRPTLAQISQRLELVVHFSAGDAFPAELTALNDYLEQHPVTGDLIIFRDEEKVTSPDTFRAASAVLKHSRLGLGTNGYFTELNRERPAKNLADVVVYPINPQVHAFDNDTMIENLSGFAAGVATARAFLGAHSHLHISPVTLKIRWNPDAVAPDPDPPPGELPRRVDPRQASLFGAGWTLGAIASLAHAGALSLTFYELAGWLGVLERANGSPLPDRFPSVPGGVFPMYHVFAAVGEFVGGQTLGFTSTQAKLISGLALDHDARRSLLIANHTADRQNVTVTGVHGSWTLTSLDEHTADQAVRNPEGFRAAPGQMVAAAAGALTLELLPYAFIRLDQRH